MDDDDKTEFGTAELWAPEPKLGAAWAGVTLVEEVPARNERSPAARPAPREVEGAVVAPPFALPPRMPEELSFPADREPHRRRPRLAGIALSACAGAALGIALVHFLRAPVEAFSGRASLALPAPSDSASLSPAPRAGTDVGLLASRERSERPEPTTPSIEELRSPAGPPSNFPSMLQRRAAQALLEGRCAEAHALLAQAREPRLAKFAAIAARVCAGGGQP